MKFYLCSQCHVLSASPICCGQDNRHCFICDSPSEILDLDASEKNPVVINNARKEKRRAIDRNLNKGDFDSFIDYTALAALYELAYEDLKKGGISKTTWNRNLLQIRLAKKNQSLDEYIEKKIAKAFRSKDYLKRMDGGSPKKRIIKLILLGAFGAALYGIPTGGLLIFGITIIAPVALLLTPAGAVLFATPIIISLLIRAYKKIKNKIAPDKDLIKCAIKTLVNTNLNKRILSSQKILDDEIQHIESDITEMINTLMQHIGDSIEECLSLGPQGDADSESKYALVTEINGNLKDQLFNFNRLPEKEHIRNAFNIRK